MTTPLRDTFDLEAMKAELIRDEDLVLHVYKDPGSGRAIGVGRNLDTQGLSAPECAELGFMPTPVHGDPAVQLVEGGINRAFAFTMLVNDITDRAHQLDTFLPWWRLLSPVRQRVLLNMAFEMGTRGMMIYWGYGMIPHPLSLPALSAIQSAHFDDAADMMLRSPWGTGKTHNRAARLAEAMRHG